MLLHIRNWTKALIFAFLITPISASAATQVPTQYNTKAAAKYDASAVQQSYVSLAGGLYSNALGAALALSKAIEALGNAPDAKALDAARGAWITARTSYLATAALRFYGGPIDGAKGANRAAGPELAISDNFRRIEAALWGKGKLAGLSTTAKALHSDIGFVLKEWDPIRRTGYAQEFLQLDGQEAIGRILRGLGMQAVALAKMPSTDTRSNELAAVLAGMHSIWHAQLNKITVPSIEALLAKIDPNAATAVSSALASAQAQAIAKDPALPATLQKLAPAIANAGTKLGVTIKIN